MAVWRGDGVEKQIQGQRITRAVGPGSSGGAENDKPTVYREKNGAAGQRASGEVKRERPAGVRGQWGSEARVKLRS